MSIAELSQITTRLVTQPMIGRAQKNAVLSQATNTLARETPDLPQMIVDSFVSSRPGMDTNITRFDQLQKRSRINGRASASLRFATNRSSIHSGCSQGCFNTEWFTSQESIKFSEGPTFPNKAGKSTVTFGNPGTPQTYPGAYGISDYSEGAALTFSDALGLLKKAGGNYRSSAELIQSLDNKGLVRINDPWLGTDANAETIGPNHKMSETLKGGPIPIGINLKSQFFLPGSKLAIQKQPGSRFESALLLAGTLHHESRHWATYSPWDNKEPMGNKAELDFYRDTFFQEYKLFQSGQSSSDRLNAIWRVGSDRRDAMQRAGDYEGPSIFDRKDQFDF